MSVVTLQLGQCGNQLGVSLFAKLAEELSSGYTGKTAPEAWGRFFRETPRGGKASQPDAPYTARAVLVDMEPKVVRAALHGAAALQWSASAAWAYSPVRAFAQQGGSGNNWALGYCRHGPAHAERACRLARREAEACDELGGFLLLHSLAGGTGSGLGACVAEALRDEFPEATILSHSVWPFERGEVVVQPYNTALTLAHLAQSVDATALAWNGALQATCQRQLDIPVPIFRDLNAVAAEALAALLLPTLPVGPAGELGARPLGLRDIVDGVCTLPGYKFLSLAWAPQMPPTSRAFTTFSWSPILRTLSQHVKAGRPGGKGRALSSLLCLRGSGAAAIDMAPLAACHAGGAAGVRLAARPQQFGGCELSGALLSNSQVLVGPWSDMQRKASKMLGAGAFVHEFERYGVERAELQEALQCTEETLARYQGLDQLQVQGQQPRSGRRSLPAWVDPVVPAAQEERSFVF